VLLRQRPGQASQPSRHMSQFVLLTGASIRQLLHLLEDSLHDSVKKPERKNREHVGMPPLTALAWKKTLHACLRDYAPKRRPADKLVPSGQSNKNRARMAHEYELQRTCFCASMLVQCNEFRRFQVSVVLTPLLQSTMQTPPRRSLNVLGENPWMQERSVGDVLNWHMDCAHQ